ncbi:hypothetical protein BCR33DRAFT_711257 [Rhizoclosmatium globosum]|uniref:Uncharacterized protein n=1 Tax=Rhizoclosmatium globosum TaxID=329046 RepID=A0A1Y2D473_9FUNG|nr:hypothetical protein BCR33DRAFT_711257 [Rhizoclosmatium globosum]|eukprot:ORY53916.1 hypothetical protein BCR33DRAFT_711257 [Rhizoclosmatium globosum]
MSSLRPPPPPSTLTSTTSPSASAPNRPIKVLTVNRQTSNSSSSSSLSSTSQIHLRRPTLVPQTPSKPQLQQQQSQSQTQIPFDAQTAKAQVNDRAVRKIMDLEIANDSLLAVNTTLENTIREQALNLEQMRKLVGVLKRKLPDSVIDQDLDSVDSMDDDLSVSGATDTANTSAFGSPAGGKRSKTFVDVSTLEKATAERVKQVLKEMSE